MKANIFLLLYCTFILYPTAVQSLESERSTNISIASLSIFPTKWDKAANSDRIEGQIREAARQGARLIITPEGALEGYVVNEVIRAKDPKEKDRLTERFQKLAEPIDGVTIHRFRKLADELNIHLVLGFLEADGNKTYNTAMLFGPNGDIVGKYRKTHFHQGYEVNPPGYTPGDTYPVFDIGLMKVGIMICFDRQPPEPARALALAGADLILCPAYGSWGDWNTRLMQVRAYENQAAVVFTHPEQSLVIDRDGKLLAECRKDEFLVHDLKLPKPIKTRQSVTQRRPDTYRSLAGRNQPKPLATNTKASRRPNILLILADDLGYQDLGCYGGDLVETPHLDQLAAEGIRFTDAYAMPVCSPSRAELLTGKYAARLHITIWSEGSIQGPKNRKLLQGHSLHDLPHSETTIAAHLHKAGYLTALVGKWHLGTAGHFPESHGFDVNIGGNHWGAPQTFWWPYRGDKRYGGEFRYVPHTEFGTPGEFLTDRLTDEAIRVINQSSARPFFLYLSHYAPHTPIEAKPDDIRYFKAKLKSDMNHQNVIYAAMVKNLDDNVGRVLVHLKERGLERNSIVIFASDNGGFIGKDRGQNVPVTSNAPLRSGKGSLYEGGIRVPLIIRWPGLTQAGSVCHEPVSLRDIYHTLHPLVAEKADVYNKAMDDGMNITKLLKDPKAKLGREALYFHYPHYYPTTTPVSGVRKGDWKLLEYFEDQRIELYNLKEDLSEAHNLATDRPSKAAELKKQLHTWRQSVSASLPQPNPNYKHRGRQK